MVILNERVGDPERRELFGVIRLHEETTRVTENLGTQFKDSGQTGLNSLHGIYFSSAL
jgi:hypothetical protein